MPPSLFISLLPMNNGPKVENMTIPSSSTNPASESSSNDISPLFIASCKLADTRHEVIAESVLARILFIPFKLEEGTSNAVSIDTII